MGNKRNIFACAGACIVMVLCAVMFCSAAAWAADWKPYAADQYFSYFYDARSVNYPYRSVSNILRLEVAKLDVVSVWTKRVVKDTKGRLWQVGEQKKQGLTTRGYERYEYTLAMRELRCQDKTYRVLSEADYSKDGEVLSSFVKDDVVAEWKKITPDSDTEALLPVLCKAPTEKESNHPATPGENQ